MKAYAVALVICGALVTTGCSGVTPLPIVAGDVCFNCNRPIADPAMAGEVITQHNQALKFRTVSCMVNYLGKNPGTAKAVFVTDFTTGRLIRASSATFVPFERVERYQKSVEFLAFRAAEGATEAAKEHDSTPITWQQVLDRAE